MCGPSSQAIQPLSLVFFVRHHPSSLSLVISSLGALPFKESGGPWGRWRGRDSPLAAPWPCRTSPPPPPPTVLDQLRDPLGLGVRICPGRAGLGSLSVSWVPLPSAWLPLCSRPPTMKPASNDK